MWSLTGPISFQGLMIINATEFLPLLPLTFITTIAIWECSQWSEWKIAPSTKKSMDWCTNHYDKTKVMLKTTLNPHIMNQTKKKSPNLMLLFSPPNRHLKPRLHRACALNIDPQSPKRHYFYSKISLYFFVEFVEDNATMSSIQYFENHAMYFVKNRRK